MVTHKFTVTEVGTITYYKYTELVVYGSNADTESMGYGKTIKGHKLTKHSVL